VRVHLGDGVRLGYGVRLGDRVRLGDGVRLGDRVDVAASLLSAFNRYGWILYRDTQSALHLAYGCEDLPLSDWTDETVRALLDQHDPGAEKDLLSVLRACHAVAD